MNIVGLNAVRSALRNELVRLDAIKPMCSNCEHYNLQHCKVYDQDPPKEWFRPAQAVECDAWEFDAIPF